MSVCAPECLQSFVHLIIFKTHSGAQTSLKTFALSNAIEPLMQAFVGSLKQKLSQTRLVSYVS